MAEETDKRFKLQDFIYQVKKEILQAQEDHEGEPALFELETVELEVKVATTYSAEGKGKLEFWVINRGEIGGKVARENVHTVKLSMKIAKPAPEPVEPPEASDDAADDGFIVMEKVIIDKKTGTISMTKSDYLSSLPKVEPGKPLFLPVNVQKMIAAECDRITKLIELE